MGYYFSTTVEAPFDRVVERTRAALQDRGFGVITEIDVEDTLKAKIGVDFRHYRVLGAYSPRLAYEALELEDKIGTLLPCNIVIQDLGCGRTEVAAIDPVASMRAVENPALLEKAHKIAGMLQAAIAVL
jgi:uncharacterized protein (DUF302 family)